MSRRPTAQTARFDCAGGVRGVDTERAAAAREDRRRRSPALDVRAPRPREPGAPRDRVAAPAPIAAAPETVLAAPIDLVASPIEEPFTAVAVAPRSRPSKPDPRRGLSRLRRRHGARSRVTAARGARDRRRRRRLRGGRSHALGRSARHGALRAAHARLADRLASRPPNHARLLCAPLERSRSISAKGRRPSVMCARESPWETSGVANGSASSASRSTARWTRRARRLGRSSFAKAKCAKRSADIAQGIDWR